MLHVLVVCVAEVLQVELLLLLLLLLLRIRPLLLEAVQLLVVVLAHLRRLLAGLGALQTGERLVGARLVLVGLAEWIRRQPLVQRQFAGVQRDALWGGRSDVRDNMSSGCTRCGLGYMFITCVKRCGCYLCDGGQSGGDGGGELFGVMPP